MSLHILIADDSATNRLLFSTLMTRLGHKVDAASGGAEAVSFFRDARYDLVFLDLNMPLMDGIKTAAEINRHNPRRIPVYALSGYAEPGQEKLFDAAGIRRCLIKPLDREKLDSVVSECNLSASPVPPPAGSQIPVKLIGVYAQELRARGDACLRHIADNNVAALSREAHTLRALGQMLKTPDVENAAALLEDACQARRINGDEAKILKDNCARIADLLETRISSASSS